MGLFDTIHCHAKAPGAELLGDREFQTTDLGRRMETFTIRDDGRLIHHRTRRATSQPVRQSAPELDVVVPLHDDITLAGESVDGRFCWYVARFTDGKLEWVKPRESLSDEHREYLWSGD